VTQEDRRQLLHFAMTAFALLLRWLTPLQACAMAAAAVILNWVLMPLFGWDRALRRQSGPFADGVKTYPVAVLLVLAAVAAKLLPMPAAAAAWGVLGAGDAASNVIGRRWGKPPFLGRRDRSLAGSIAFVAAAFPLAWSLAAWTAPEGTAPWHASLAAALAGALAELVPLPRGLDDNVPITLAAAAAYCVV
jgi:dolichol kinase